MKSIFNVLFFFISMSSFAQSDGTLVEIPKLNSGVFGDELIRVVTAGENGAVIRFVDPSLGTAMWNVDSLMAYLIQENALDSNSTSNELSRAVGGFVKKGEILNNIQGFGAKATITNPDSSMSNYTSDFVNVFNLPSADNSNFAGYFCALTNKLAKQLGSEIQVSSLSLNGHISAEYFDVELNRWIIVDVDPKSKMFMPIYNGQPLSVDELVKNPKLLLKDEELWNRKYSNKVDSLLTFMAYKELQFVFSQSKEYKRYETAFEEMAFDYFIRLAPNQSLKWSYTNNGLSLNQNKCAEEFTASMDIFESGDSARIVKALFEYADCHKIEPRIVVPKIAGGSILFSDSTYFGKDNIRNNTFSTVLAKGEYEIGDVYIPHNIKKIDGELSINEDELENFEMDLYDFSENAFEKERYVSIENFIPLNKAFTVKSEEVNVEFYSNDQVNFVVDEVFRIVVIEGDLAVRQYVNGELRDEVLSVK